jgi:hypothetical protein
MAVIAIPVGGVMSHRGKKPARVLVRETHEPPVSSQTFGSREELHPFLKARFSADSDVEELPGLDAEAQR